jgi:hypothetical protein
MKESYEPTKEDLAQLVRDCERMQNYDMSPEDLLRMAKGQTDFAGSLTRNLNGPWRIKQEGTRVEFTNAFAFESKPSRLARAMTWVRGIFK